MVRRAEPGSLELDDAEVVAGELAQAVQHLGDQLDQSHDFWWGEAQWHVLRLVLDWMADWEQAWADGRAAVDPANFVKLFPVAWQYMNCMRVESMGETVPYIKWSMPLLSRVAPPDECLAELKAAESEEEVAYWSLLSRDCATLVGCSCQLRA